MNEHEPTKYRRKSLSWTEKKVALDVVHTCINKDCAERAPCGNNEVHTPSAVSDSARDVLFGVFLVESVFFVF